MSVTVSCIQEAGINSCVELGVSSKVQVALLVPILLSAFLTEQTYGVCICLSIIEKIPCVSYCAIPSLCRYVRRQSVRTSGSAGEEASTRQPLPPSWYTGNTSR